MATNTRAFRLFPHSIVAATMISSNISANAEPQETSPALEQVIVYAQKKISGESVQDVPLAITALNAQLISATHAVDLLDIGYMSPSVHLAPVGTYPNFSNFTIRGVGVNGSVRTVDPAVNVVIDGMTVGFPAGMVIDTFDLESLEIMRGPQGILHGRNTTGGAVSVRTVRPDGEFGLNTKLTLGNFGRTDISAAIKGKLVEDRLNGKLAVMWRDMDGLFKDRNGGTFVPAPMNPSGMQPANSSEDQVAIEKLIVRPTLVWTPSDNLEITFIGEYQESEGGGGVSQLSFPSDATVSGTAIRDLYGYTPPSDKYEINLNVGDHELKTWHAIGEIVWALGSGAVTSISAYREVDYLSSTDLDGSPFHLLEFPDNDEESEQFSQEIRYNYEGSDLFDFVAGLYYFEHAYRVNERRPVNETLFFDGAFQHDQTTYAIFSQFNFHLTDRLTVGIGGRQTWEEKEIDMQTIGLCTGGGWTGCSRIPLSDRADWSDFSPAVKVQYEINDDVMSYASWAKGFRSGNYFGRIVTTSTDANAVANARSLLGPTDAETLSSWELGVKSTLSHRGYLNVAAFLSKYDDIQRIVSIPGSTALQSLRNAASATIKGVEVEAAFFLTDALKLEANLGWLDPSYDSFDGLDLTGDGAPDEPVRNSVCEAGLKT